MSQVTPDEQADEAREPGGDEVVDAFQCPLQLGPVVPQGPPAPDEEHHPGHGAEEREHDEPPERHPRDPRRDRDERPDDGQHPREEHRRVAITREVPVSQIEVVPADQDEAAITLEQRSPAEGADRVRDEGAERVPDDAGDHRAPVRPWRSGERLRDAAGHRPPGEREDDLARDGDRGALDRHRDDDAEVAEGRVRPRQQWQDICVDRVEHRWLSSVFEAGSIRPVGDGSAKGKGVPMSQTMRSALDERMREGVDRVGRADVLVGIPSFNNAATVGHVARTAAAGLREHFPDARAVIVNADGGSKDGTRDAVLAATGEVPAISGEYVGPPGKGSAFHAIFEAAGTLGARACAVVDSDLRSIRPTWIDRLLGPVVADGADYVTPLYARHKYDGTITNSVAYPLTRALYGIRLRQPIGGEFGFSAALVRNARIVQAFLGAKIHDPKDPGADLAPMFTQVVGTAFRLAIANHDRWVAVTDSRPAEVVGDLEPVEPEPVNASVETLERKFAAGRAEHGATWERVLSRGLPDRFDDTAWARIVYDFLLAARRAPVDIGTLTRALVPLYFARVAAFIADARELTTAQSEELVESQARAFEGVKGDLAARW